MLCYARTSGGAVINPLQITEILGLVNMGGIVYIGDKPKYLRLMQKLDRTFLEHQAETSAKPST